VLARMDRIKVPVYVFTGWQDMYSRGDLRFIDGVAARDSCLVIDPSTHHGTGQGGEVGAPYDDGSDCRLALSAAPPKGEDQAWLDRFLKGVHNGIEGQARVRYFDMGDRTWHSAPDLALGRHGAGAALPLGPEERLRPALAQRRHARRRLSRPPATPIRTPTSTTRPPGADVPMGKEGPDGFLPYMHLDAGLDEPQGLTFTGPELKAPLHLGGPSELHFWAITEASDMAFVGRLIDVAPGGGRRASSRRAGCARASATSTRSARGRGAPYLPDDRDTPVGIGETTEYRMDIWDTGLHARAGPSPAAVAELVGQPDPRAAGGGGAQPHHARRRPPSQLLISTASAGAPCGAKPEACPPLPKAARRFLTRARAREDEAAQAREAPAQPPPREVTGATGRVGAIASAQPIGAARAHRGRRPRARWWPCRPGSSAGSPGRRSSATG